MKITKRQLRRIIKEAMSHRDAETYLYDKAHQYHSDPSLNPDAVKTLLQDDFMDDFGHELRVDDYADLIDQLSRPPAPSALSAEEMAWEID